ncbi:tRNA lysidine(34) synthetase TilS [Altererythrobacter lutimaris]|uniref:tRNA(Ile)-lysidine synthase n=1 Tax=Altererythrobacter lutimaris TaxID=2743979 RepID=A0A850HCZ6_9SPHN|nr:tRNA lysidine(34) synthetase TilS [Altererythrobacter lutimaris]
MASIWPKDEKLGLAVSGGPDSLALLVMAHAARPGMVEAASVDHGLRQESQAECKAVHTLCDELGVSHKILRVDVPAGNLQDGARAARYAALKGWMSERGLRLLATAHHADDQAETLLMRLNRASGLAGLAAIRPSRMLDENTDPNDASAARLIRPLLGWRKAELEAVVSTAGVEPARDPSNRDPQFDRVRMRDALAEAEWLDPLSIASSAKHLSEALEGLEWAAAREWDEQIETRDEGLLYSPTAPRAVQLLVLERAFRELGGSPRGGAIGALRDRLVTGEGGNLAGVLVSIEGESWRLRREPPRQT